MPRWVPNAVSLVRLPLAIAMTLTYSRESAALMIATAILVVVAQLTDWADGFIARRLGVDSKTGYVIDGFGDRAVYIALTLAIARDHLLPVLLVWTIVFREVAIYAIRVVSSNLAATFGRYRGISITHAWGMRLWLLSYITIDTISASGIPIYSRVVMASQYVLIATTMCVAYCGLLLMFKELLLANECFDDCKK